MDDTRENTIRDKRKNELIPSSSYSIYISPSKKVIETKNYKFIAFMIILNIFIFIITMDVGKWKFEKLSLNPLFGPSMAVLEQMGAQNSNLVNDGGWWRLFTSMFIHAGIIHLLFNMIALYRLGMDLEPTFGSFKISIIYLLSGAYGSIASTVMLPNMLSVGASGAIFGLFGACWANCIQNWQLLANRGRHLIILSLGTILNFGIGLLPIINNFAHIGGFCVGLTLGLTLLVQKIYTRDNILIPMKLHQKNIRWSSLIIFHIIFIFGILCLYFHIQGNEFCQWCKYLSCIETSWWSCNDPYQDLKCYGKLKEDNLIYVKCPDGREVKSKENSIFNGELCKELCF